MIDISDKEFSLLRDLLIRYCGIDVPSEKKYLFQTRLAEFLAEDGYRSFSDLCARLIANPDRALQRRLIQAMTTHESGFFRDSHPFELLTRRLLPNLAARRRREARHHPPRLRILSCGCSAGQEPYSIAMCVRDWVRKQTAVAEDDVTIIGTDISQPILQRATAGQYTESELGRHLPEDCRSRYFSSRNGTWLLAPEIRRRVLFAELNLADSFAFLGRFDIIFCRNVIIYFSRELKARIVAQFCDLLYPDGALILGASESLYMISDQFRAVHDGPTTYYVPLPRAGQVAAQAATTTAGRDTANSGVT